MEQTDPKKQVKELELLKASYHKVFATEEGKRVLKDLQGVCFMNSTTINENANITAFNEGCRSVLLHIQTRMNLGSIHRLKEEDDE